jgi:hypothetical protein
MSLFGASRLKRSKNLFSINMRLCRRDVTSFHERSGEALRAARWKEERKQSFHFSLPKAVSSGQRPIRLFFPFNDADALFAELVS